MGGVRRACGVAKGARNRSFEEGFGGVMKEKRRRI